ncbi:substrate-binding domain-containing protein [Elstera litoralis]|uniref:substrate-binding domain-containing protein n=1 Tax=Elstera litoralis TaxID=552518 RepID=UPI000ACDCD06|nr:substrate-binding domain-containing protein [Elstera litoralis]
MNIKTLALGLAAGASLLALATGAQAQSKLVVGVSWSNFQEERWKIDEAAIKKQLASVGAEYISADAQSNPQKQLADVESLIARGAKALIVLAQDAQAIQPAVAKAKAEKIPVLGYDRLIEVPGVFLSHLR